MVFDCGACLLCEDDDVDDNARHRDDWSAHSGAEKGRHMSLNALALRRMSSQKVQTDVVDYGGSAGTDTIQNIGRHNGGMCIRRPRSRLCGPRSIPLEIRCKIEPEESKTNQKPSRASFNDSFDSNEFSSKRIRVRLSKPMGIVFEPLDRGGVRICELPYSGAAAQSGKVEVWDELLSVNGESMRRRTFDQVMAFFVDKDPDMDFDLVFKRRSCYTPEIKGDKYDVDGDGGWGIYQ